MFAGSRSGLSFRLQEGQQVIVLGSVSVYERDGKYQLYAREIVRDGLGALYEKYEALKKELEEMACFLKSISSPFPGLLRQWDCYRAHGSRGSRYYQYLTETQSLCPADSLSCPGAGRRGRRRAL